MKTVTTSIGGSSTIPTPTLLSALLAVVLVSITIAACSTRNHEQPAAARVAPRASLITRVRRRVVAIEASVSSYLLTMARPVSRTEAWKVVSVSCSVELWNELDVAVKAIGITKRELVEDAVRRELALRRIDGHYGRSDGQEALPA